MSNPIFNALTNNAPLMGGQNAFTNMIQQFKQFQQSFSGDPRQQVQQLLNSGRMTQQQYNSLAQAANMFKSLLK